MSGGVEVHGAIAVDTEEMLRAAAVLAEARSGLQALADRAAGAAAAASPLVGPRLEEAHGLLLEAARETAAASDGLRLAALRYGWAEQLAAGSMQSAAAGFAAGQGSLIRLLGPVAGFSILSTDLTAFTALAVGRLVQRFLETGRVDPRTDLVGDPVLIRLLGLVVSSLDDGVRGFLAVETPWDVLHDDPRSVLGTQAVAAAIAGAVWPAGAGAAAITVHRTTVRRVQRPAGFEQLVDRLPKEEPAGQVRIERYQDADGPRWVVYSAGTLTFALRSGTEPFDLESDVRGVAGQPTDSEQAVLTAMEQAGIGRGDPVLLVGHSQGALNAARIAEQGGYRVDGVVQFGGPTATIPAPPGVPVLSYRHPEDLVPVLGGVAPVTAGTVVVTRSLPDSGRLPGPPTGTAIDQVPAHSTVHYRETARQSDSLHSPAVEGLRRRWAGFFTGGDGEATRYRARREAARVSGPAGPARTAGAGPARPASR